MKEYIAMWKNGLNFHDRTTVKGYWMAFLWNMIIASFFSGGVLLDGRLYEFSLLYSLLGAIPGVALSVRRLHDIDKSGWWLAISFVPFIGAVILLVWFCKASVNEGNTYGQNQV